ncbi:MAG TPA: lipopolysaccharide heptosyltransferase II [Rhabdochlamydiaceae bacterium]|nr:lipopolysaccharide heptosyltransferase II [Rhabdochlamydiaceae bacterium]
MDPLQETEFKNIIVRMPNWIGDLVMATPILADLRKTYPKAKITAMCRAPVCDLIKEDPEIDELFCFSKTSGFPRKSDKKNVIEKLKMGKYDLGVLLTHSFSSCWWFWRGGVGHRLGYDCNGRRILLTKSVRLPEEIDQQHLVMTYKMLLQPLGIPLSNSCPTLYLSETEVSEAMMLLKQHGVTEKSHLVGINPGATYGSAKCWLPSRFREVTEKLLTDPEIYIVYFGDQSTVALVKEICQGLGCRVINLAGLTSLRELAALISLCSILLTNDSGPMHIADALGTPILALFGSTNEIVTGPYRTGKVIHKHVECSPCYQRTCPIDFRCMKKIDSEEVYQEILRMLDQKETHNSLKVLNV